MKKIRAGIVGVSGYTGLELTKILITHPNFELSYASNTQGGVLLSQLHPCLEGVFDIEVKKTEIDEVAKNCDVVFLALPHKAAMGFAKELASSDVKIVDLSADYRLSASNYELNYCEHIDKEGLASAVYGLPELFGEQIKSAKLLANPGCYPTATLLALAPFAKYIDEKSPVFVDAKSGVSGAGKKCVDRTHFVSANENLFAYDPITHRHSVEISEKIEIISGKPFHITFVPQLLPITRGMLSNVYATLKEDIEPLEVLREFYKDSAFVRVKESAVQLKSVCGTNFCDLYAAKNKNALFVNSAIDNLLRGASSQAVVNANIMFGLSEDAGVPKIAYAP
ncbi:MAG TPA: N-acetyl-gamma-glutamyl-phosphate reductase [Campylobacterales bacterium]|nr:N-acetyl-gamma-glutamyl-phosphate reductase [Campylobacterales bacterium]